MYWEPINSLENEQVFSLDKIFTLPPCIPSLDISFCKYIKNLYAFYLKLNEFLLLFKAELESTGSQGNEEQVYALPWV